MQPFCSSPGTIERPELHDSSQSGKDRGWIVTVYNNEHNTYEEVMTVLILATHCDEQEAWIETWEIDHLGQSVVHQAGQEECAQVASIISSIGIRVEVSQEC